MDKPKRTSAEVRKLVDNFYKQEHGLSKSAYCKSNKMSASSFYKYSDNNQGVKGLKIKSVSPVEPKSKFTELSESSSLIRPKQKYKLSFFGFIVFRLEVENV